MMTSRISFRQCDFCAAHGYPEETDVQLCEVDGQPTWLCDGCIDAFEQDAEEEASND